MNEEALEEATEQSQALADAVSGFSESVLNAVTPGRKRKKRYNELSDSTLPDLDGSNKSVLFDEELVIIPSVDSQDSAAEEKLAVMMGQWDMMVSAVNKLTKNLKRLKLAIGED
jgi:hypothetical protein